MGIRTRLHQFKVSFQPTFKELKFTFDKIQKSALSIVGAAIVVFFILIALLAPILAPRPSYAPSLDPYMMPQDSFWAEPRPPSPAHPFGTSNSQYDIYYGVIWGTRIAFYIGLWVILASLAIGLAVGSIAGYTGGLIDEILMRFTDVILAFPGLILAMAFVAVLIPLGIVTRLDAVLLALVLVGWPGYARIIRGEILRVKSEDYVEAAKAVGCSNLRVLLRHIFPNSIYTIVILATLDIGSMVLTAAALSFLGLGSPPGYADWGQLINLSRNYIYGKPAQPFIYWYTWLVPGAFIFAFVFGWNLLGDAFRDILDPTIRRR